MHLFKQLRQKIDYLSEAQIKAIYSAYLFASEAHASQRRGNGDLFITHPLSVAMILAEMQMDHQSIIAALLHDTIEDTPVTKDKITEQFGSTVAELVDGVTKLTQMEISSKAEAQAESFRKMVLAMSRDIRVIMVKLADRLHNMRTIFGIPAYKRNRICRETLDIYAPIANRLGMHEMCIELDNLAFAAIYPRRYRVLSQAVEKIRGNRKQIMKTIEKEIINVFAKSSIYSISIIGREKHLYGIYKKMVSHKRSFSEIMDVYAFRIIVDTIDDCYHALGIVHSLYKPVPGKFKDYIAIPKYNGYQSLHTVLFGLSGIPIEIQIRTHEMDQMANNGIAAHWLYKSGDKLADAAHIRAQHWVNNLLEMQQNTGSSLEFIENVKIDLFPDEVYVFTPKGNILELPRGATAVDYAYTVHSDIGNTCVAVRVDQQFVPLSTVLLNGQTVSIITAPSAKPSPEWLTFVVTGKARSEIRNYLKSQKRSESIALGKQLLEKALSELSVDINKISPAAIDRVLKEAKFKQLEDLYEDIGLGKRLGVFVAHQLLSSIESRGPVCKVASAAESKPLIIRGAEGLAINFAPCCCPIPGDQIIGYLNVGSGLDIHTEDCVNLPKLRKQPEKCIAVMWADDVHGTFRVKISLEMHNQRGSIAAMAKAIAEANSTIGDIRMGEDRGGYCMVTLKIQVNNVLHLERVLRHLASSPVVIGVIRKKTEA